MINREIVQEEHYGEVVWTHKELDDLRRTECLCHLCKEEATGYCPYANKLYEVCVTGGIATIVSRCRDFKAKE